jgi:hypothetical protein
MAQSGESHCSTAVHEKADAKFRDFKFFHYQQAVAFKHLPEQYNIVSGKKLSKAILASGGVTG